MVVLLQVHPCPIEVGGISGKLGSQVIKEVLEDMSFHCTAANGFHWWNSMKVVPSLKANSGEVSQLSLLSSPCDLLGVGSGPRSSPPPNWHWCWTQRPQDVPP